MSYYKLQSLALTKSRDASLVRFVWKSKGWPKKHVANRGQLKFFTASTLCFTQNRIKPLNATVLDKDPVLKSLQLKPFKKNKNTHNLMQNCKLSLCVLVKTLNYYHIRLLRVICKTDWIISFYVFCKVHYLWQTSWIRLTPKVIYLLKYIL